MECISGQTKEIKNMGDWTTVRRFCGHVDRLEKIEGEDLQAKIAYAERSVCRHCLQESPILLSYSCGHSKRTYVHGDCVEATEEAKRKLCHECSTPAPPPAPSPLNPSRRLFNHASREPMVSHEATEAIKTGETGGLWRKHGMSGKYLVQRRDGTVPEWPGFVLGAKDPAAPAALRAYADAAEKLGFNPQYVSDVRELADEFEAYCLAHGKGDPDGVPHRKDDPEIVKKINGGTM